MKKILHFASIVLIFTKLSHAQIGINTQSPRMGAVLDISSNPNQPGGLLIPQMESSYRMNLSTSLGVGFVIPNSLLLFDQSLNKLMMRDSQEGKWMVLNPFYAPIDEVNKRAYIGIGTVNPTEFLHLKNGNLLVENGNFNISGNITSSGNISSNNLTINNSINVFGFATNALVPSGVILMWNGNTSNIPTGWVLCDGNNGAPDLRDRFIVGAGSTYAVGDKGGKKNLTLDVNQLPSHNHGSGSLVMPDHKHGYVTKNSKNDGQGGIVGGNNDNGAYGEVYGVSNYDNNKQITGSTSNTGSGSSIDITPPFFALCFIMKL
jgi:microcystin-dependent protein